MKVAVSVSVVVVSPDATVNVFWPAVSVAALTIYDMCKAVDKRMRVTNVRLVSKTKSAMAGQRASGKLGK